MRCFLLALLFLNSAAFAGEIAVKRYSIKGDFAFYEPTVIATPGVGFYYRKVQTKLLSQVDGTTTSGRPIKIWQIRSWLIDDAARIDAAVVEAKKAFPEWTNFIFQARPVTRKYCHLNLVSADILVQSGVTDNSAEVSNDVCLLTIASRSDEAEQQIQAAIADGTVIDYGVDPIVFKQSNDIVLNINRIHRVLSPIKSRLNQVEARETYFYAGYAMARNDTTGILTSAPIETTKAIIHDVTAALFVANAEGESFNLLDAPATETITVKAGKSDVFKP